MHGVTLDRINLLRKAHDQMEANCRLLGMSGLGDILVNGWSGPDAFTHGPEVGVLSDAIMAGAKHEGTPVEEASTQVCTILRTLAEFSGIRRHGLHEFSVSAEQAVGMGLMRFNMSTSDFQPPVDCMYVVIPRDFFLREEITPLLDSYCEAQAGVKEGHLGKVGLRAESTSNGGFLRDDDAVRRFREKPSDVTVAIVRNGPCVMTNVVSCGVNTHVIFNAQESMEETLSKPTALSDLDRVLVRVALSAALLATMRPKDLLPMPLDAKQVRERGSILAKIKTVVLPSYLIFQKSLRTFSRPPADSSSEPCERRQQDERFVRPHFVHGHWRHQAYGPKWSLRRFRYIAPQIRHRSAFLGRQEDVITETRLAE